MDEKGLLLAKWLKIRDCCADIFAQSCLHHDTPDLVAPLAGELSQANRVQDSESPISDAQS